jgi:hypothetical protein
MHGEAGWLGLGIDATSKGGSERQPGIGSSGDAICQKLEPDRAIQLSGDRPSMATELLDLPTEEHFVADPEARSPGSFRPPIRLLLGAEVAAKVRLSGFGDSESEGSCLPTRSAVTLASVVRKTG